MKFRMKQIVGLGVMAVILLASTLRADINWTNYIFTISSASNHFAGDGIYTFDHIANGKGAYKNSSNPYGTTFTLSWVPHPDTNHYSWWLTGDGGTGPYEYRGNGLFPDSLNFQEPNVSANAGGSLADTKEPVNVINGGMFFDEPEIGIAADGFDLEWTRTYNSALSTTNGLGFRWSHNYDWSLTQTTNVYINGSFTNATPALLLTMGNGEARMLLKDDGTNIWRSVHTPQLALCLTTSSEYALTLPLGRTCVFGTNGLIKAMSNAWNTALTFAYTNAGDNVCLATVTHSDGRSLKFTYAGNRLARVDTPSTNLSYLYTYNASGELTNAITRLPSGDYSSSYAYDTNGAHALTAHSNPLGEVAAYAYLTNTQGQLTTQCCKVDVATNYYGHTLAYNGNVTTVTYNKGNTNAVYRYTYDPATKQIARIDLPSDTNEFRLLAFDSLTRGLIADQIGNSLVHTTNDLWSLKSYYAVSTVNTFINGYYDYYRESQGKGNYTNHYSIPPPFRLAWQGSSWLIACQGAGYYNSSPYPQYGSWHDSQGSNVSINVYTVRDDISIDTQWNGVGIKGVYDAQGYLASYYPQFTSTSSPSWAFTWNTNWNMLASATDPEGHRTEWDYTNGSVSVERIFPATNQTAETRYAYTGNGRLAGVTNGNGSWAQFLYDSYGYPTQTLSASGMTNWMTWNVLGHLTALTLPSHLTDTNSPPNMIPRVITFDSNELGWVNKITYPDDSLETFLFDGIGNLTNHIDTAGRTNSFAWLPTRKLASATRFLITGGSNQEARVSMAYDQQMNVLNIKDELNRAVEGYKLDLQDRPVSITNVEGQVMSLSWGVGTILNGMARFDGSSLEFSYDEGARLRLADFPDESLSLGYYRNGLLMTASNRWGIISNAFDGANRLTAQTQPVPAGHLAYTYYPAGQVSNVMSAAGTNTYTLDASDRLQSIAVSGPDLRKDSFTYTHDTVNGLVSGMSASNGLKCAYAYDVMDRLTGISWSDASNRVLRSRSFTYTPAGLISNITFETGEKALYSYDSLDRLTREKHTDYYGQVISDETYEYDLAGNRTKKVVLDANGSTLLTLNYSLPVANKLGSWTVPETNLATRFSVVGSSADPIGVGIRYGTLWVSNSPSAHMTPYVASTTNFYAFDLICGMGTQYIHAAIRDMAGNTSYVTNRFYPTCITNGTYQYSAAGCLTNREYSGKDYSDTLGLTWNGQYQLTSATTNGTLAEAYGYDGLGRRVFIAEGGVTNWMVYDGNQVVAEVDGSGQLKKSYVYEGLDRAVAMTTYGAVTNTFYFIRDHLGSTLALVDGSGNIVESYRYDAWGRVLGVYNADGNQIAESAVGNRILWQGREYSWATGLYNFRARWYDPVTGRWLSKDPIGISGGLNQYVFCGNNPVNFRDPSGLCEDSIREISWWDFNVRIAARNIGRNAWNTVTDPTVALGLTMVTDGAWAGVQAAFAAEKLGPIVGVLKNRAAGNAFRDEVAEALRKAGRDVATEVYKRTPFGKRFIDIEVSLEGKVIGGVEAKVGGARYTTLQRIKDTWLRLVDDYIVNVVRDR